MNLLSILFLAGFLASCSFTPPGPRALLKGEKLIQQGKYEQAIESLQTAVRLLPKNAQAWNYLGLAYHGAKQPAQAIKAYNQALALDHKLAAVRFNLGCVYLEENDLLPAMDQLTSYTLIEPRSVQGFLKLATAQLRAKRFDLAEKNFKTVLELQPKNVEALNGLGISFFQRRRVAEAQNYFNQALALDPDYPPAILNSAMLAQQGFNNRPLALQKYKQYLALQPRPENWAAVFTLAGQLESELHPASEPPAIKPVAPAPRPNPPHPQTTTVTRVVASNSMPLVPVVRSNVNVARTVPPKTNPPPPTNTTFASLPSVTKTSNPPPIAPPKQPEMEVTQVKDDLVIKPTQDVTNLSPALGATEPNFKSSAAKPEKRGIFSRLNPFSTRPKTPDSIVVAVSSNEVKEITPANGSEPAPELAPIAKYTFLSPSPPAVGNHKSAEAYFTQGVKAQTSHEFARALSEYHKAIQLDPAYFEAYYNQGLAAYELGVWKTALTSFEYALALKPNFTDARYNFALALKQSNYLYDAADELHKVLKENPKDVRAHLSLGNLYAQKLNQPDQAREHYMQVLQNAPTHPKAAEIRYWLAAHP